MKRFCEKPLWRSSERENARRHLSTWHVRGVLYLFGQLVILFLPKTNGGGSSYQWDSAWSPTTRFDKQSNPNPALRKRLNIATLDKREGSSLFSSERPSHDRKWPRHFHTSSLPLRSREGHNYPRQTGQGSSCHTTRGVSSLLSWRLEGPDVLSLPLEEGSYLEQCVPFRKIFDEKHSSREKLFQENRLFNIDVLSFPRLWQLKVNILFPLLRRGYLEELLMIGTGPRLCRCKTLPSKGRYELLQPMLVMSSLFVFWGVHRYYPRLKASLLLSKEKEEEKNRILRENWLFKFNFFTFQKLKFVGSKPLL